MLNRTVVVSGGFDPIHLGHIELIKEARSLAGKGLVFVVVDSDEYVSSKHKLMFPQSERACLIENLSNVDSVLFGDTVDGNCINLLMRYPPDIYLVGPDHADHTQLPEYEYCKATHIEILTATRPRSKEWHSRDYSLPKWRNPIVTVSAILKNIQEQVLISVRGIQGGKGLNAPPVLELPGGFLEIDEDLEEGVRREVREEIGVGISQLEYLYSFPGKYSDGRDIISIYFEGYIDGIPECSAESLETFWCNKLPSEPFYNATDRQALAEYLGEE